MDRPEFLRMKLDNFPDDVIEQYNLKGKDDEKGFVILRVGKGMYGLPYAGIIAQNLLEKRLELHGYTQSDKTPGFWSHKWTILALSMWGKNMPTICFLFSRNTMSWMSTGKTAKNTAASPWTGTTSGEKSTCLCQDTA